MGGRLVRRRGLHAPIDLDQHEARGIVILLHHIEARDARFLELWLAFSIVASLKASMQSGLTFTCT